MTTLLHVEELPAKTLEKLQLSAEAHNLPVAAEVVRLLEASLGELSEGSRSPSPVLTTDEGPASCEIRLMGPSRIVWPISGGDRIPTPVVDLDGAGE
jgi:hypothetical protein